MDKIINDYNNGISLTKLNKIYPYSSKKISSELKIRGIAIKKNDFYARKYNCNSNYFSVIDTEDKAYWLGFILADGYLSPINKHETSPKLGISIIDKEHLDKFKSNINTNYPIHTYEVTSGYKVGSTYHRIIIKDNQIVNDLIKNGIEYNKTGKVKYPIVMKNHRFERDFLRGYFDGNGNIRGSYKSFKNGAERIYYKIGFNGTYEFLSYIKENIFHNIGNRELGQRHPDRNNNNYDFEINKIKDIHTVLDYMYQDATVYLNRKYNKYIDFKKNHIQ